VSQTSQYDSIATEYSITRQAIWPNVANDLKNLPVESTILDLGCGNGVALNHLNPNISYTGVDNSTGLLGIANTLHPQAHFVLGDLTDSSIIDKLPEFDLILCLSVLHHLYIDQQKQLMLNIAHHLKPKGQIIISNWDLSQPKFKKYLINNSYQIPFHSTNHVRSFYQVDLSTLIKDTDLSIVYEYQVDKNKAYRLSSVTP
jgi:2-polyprenyl-3-methyl-5-hydroxy-6-metoxy-1,4-benzoquinol methylase